MRNHAAKNVVVIIKARRYHAAKPPLQVLNAATEHIEIIIKLLRADIHDITADVLNCLNCIFRVFTNLLDNIHQCTTLRASNSNIQQIAEMNNCLLLSLEYQGNAPTAIQKTKLSTWTEGVPK